MPEPGSASANHDRALLRAEQPASAICSGNATSKRIDPQGISICLAYSRLTMCVRRDMVDGHPTCHDRSLFTLADSALAYPCNRSNRKPAASACPIDCLSLARESEARAADDGAGRSSTGTAAPMTGAVQGNLQ
ncbi:hypothetical protein [Candidatus Accumulibacter sp. ACC007]|uniref:hypothetical protein n=1 Tax=Candidatus Accumulibacter sp. ACC007 TaxID=2823333 RepID=UPI0025C0E82B|nr:hypothetical protein [Candidatus Accumulibacter sp. ACC007]